jgi:hypothetical protein
MGTLNFFQISTDFELFRRLRVKDDLTDLCSNRLIATIFSNQSELHFRQEVLYGDLKSLHYHLVDIHKLSPKIQKVIKF